jgi:hypothetical protein
MDLIHENGIGPEKWKLDPVRRAAAGVGLVQVIGCQIQVERTD